ncbi:hypothetical protein CURE108131_02000 [Cupriavidus respiraculi]|uniref:Uncharacterized protein n=1 Tax=Cupriavidus respiraculi TaxID=195930 RepID=A0ABM8WFD2_9BURK|nr:hypothetical protein LMG21510_00272 [Cupriavidus respiraculi]
MRTGGAATAPPSAKHNAGRRRGPEAPLTSGVVCSAVGFRGGRARAEPYAACTASSALLNVALGRITALTLLRSGK